MDLIFFDLDGTLLNDASEISTFTKETLALLQDKNIAYTIATGRTMHSAQRILAGHVFDLPQIYNNGVTLWDPQKQQLTLENQLNHKEISNIIDVAATHGITPFVNVIDAYKHFIFHSETRHDIEQQLIDNYFSGSNAQLMPLAAMPSQSQATNISMIGHAQTIKSMWQELNTHDQLVAYVGQALAGNDFWWMDVHHQQASKGAAVTSLKAQLDASKVICFGDGENDLSMFALADESYAPENAKLEIKNSATSVIGHNHQDGIAHFLRERFSL
ncbi:HAD family hydrolase [uncultured Paraglaciecola sp.]|uniref:HAD family hydrolase n=1 Tax=uncultured Paraglaciecola sp. TaxID=1765024 RepID=UPI00261584F1|nr:HAD family hydrolase [uncultured Paraglaciecola sp.]